MDKHESNQPVTPEAIFERLRLMRDCPLCGYTYADRQVALIEEGEAGNLVHITCERCQNAILAIVVMSGVGVSSVGSITDMTAADARRLCRREPISDDQILGLHECLETGRGLEDYLMARSLKQTK